MGFRRITGQQIYLQTEIMEDWNNGGLIICRKYLLYSVNGGYTPNAKNMKLIVNNTELDTTNISDLYS